MKEYAIKAVDESAKTTLTALSHSLSIKLVLWSKPLKTTIGTVGRRAKKMANELEVDTYLQNATCIFLTNIPTIT